jgi:hypothetical protein
VSEPLVPAAVRVLRDPLALTSASKRADALAAADAETLVDVLERVLYALEEVQPVDDRAVPADLLNTWSFTTEWLSEAMPTLSAITREAVVERLAEFVADPSPALVEGIGRYWLRDLLESHLSDVLAALGRRGRTGALETQADRLLEVAEQHVPSATPTLAAQLLRSVAIALGDRAVPLLARLAGTETLDPLVRDEAELDWRWLTSE